MSAVKPPPPARGKPSTHDVRIQFGPKANSRYLTTYSRAVLASIMREAGVTSVWITSTYRDASDQARAMVQNIEKHGAASQKTLYRGKPGAELVDLYVREQAALDDAASRGIDTGVKSAFARQRHLMRVLEQKIEDMGADKISRHSGLQAILNVFDVAPSSMTPDKRPAFLKAARSDPRVSRIIPPPKDPAFHFEIAQVGDFEVSSLAKTTA